jgi:hypothetical protein
MTAGRSPRAWVQRAQTRLAHRRVLKVQWPWRAVFARHICEDRSGIIRMLLAVKHQASTVKHGRRIGQRAAAAFIFAVSLYFGRPGQRE